MNRKDILYLIRHANCFEQMRQITANLSWADLRWADLSEADLSWADLRWADLSEADLSEADLRWANLSEADLSWADLRWADLSEANLSEADLRWANLSEANLSGADLSGADLSLTCKWHIKACGDMCEIGYKTKTFDEWDDWFAGDEVFETLRDSFAFEQIRISYEWVKGLRKFCKF